MKKYLIASMIAAAAACPLYAQTAPMEEKMEKVAAIKVEKIVTATGVENREPVGEAVSFDKTAGKVYTWTRITAEQVPARIKHVYYADNKKVFELELNINASPYRVWSNKTVWPGNWKVEVTDEAGTVLASIEFTVSDTKPAMEPMEAEEPKKTE